ncbi:MAG: hypothetical protein DRR16_29480 [Candidatus Parabeggiatoa sp. nov. 3]|nr:MAG: hypothetical protein DRR16_29480 [Gammaproteobacteria bacterium]
MPKKGVSLTPEASQKIKNYLKQNNLSQEEFAEDVLKVSPKTFRNWLSGKHSVDFEALNIIIEKLGIGVNDLLGDVDKYNCTTGVVSTIREIYQNNVAVYVEKSYRKIFDLFRNHITFLKYPKDGYFKTFKHDIQKGQNYYFEFQIKLMEEIEEAKFVVSFTVNNQIRINYGEVRLEHDKVDIIQYFQPPDYSVKRAGKNTIRVATWFDELPHTFVINSQIPFEIEEKGKISEYELNQANDIAVFWKHFFFINFFFPNLFCDVYSARG